MRVLWARGTATSAEIISALAPKSDWKPNTVKTLLARLVKKGAVSVRRAEREHVFSPAVTEAECASAETRSFLRRVYDGAMTNMIAGFIEREELSQREIEELRQMLDEAARRNTR